MDNQNLKKRKFHIILIGLLLKTSGIRY